MEVDLSIPDGVPSEIAARLLALQQELEEGDITSKGYRKHKEQILGAWQASREIETISSQKGAPSIYSASRQSYTHSPQPSESLYGVSTNTGSQVVRPNLASITGPLQPPQPPRGIPDTARSDPLNVSVRLTNFDNLPSILRHRGRTNAEITAFTVLDGKGKESQSITWGKLASRAEKVAQQLRDQSRMFRGDRVLLIYTELEPIEFISALMGCFIAGFVAVPMLPSQINEVPAICKATQGHLILSSEAVYKHVQKTYPEVMGSLREVAWWRTSDWGSYNYRKSELPALQVPDLAYIDYARSPLGELRGVVMSHRTILHQMTSLTAMLQSREAFKGKARITPDKVICNLDVRRSTGLIIGVLHAIYSGNSILFIPSKVMTTPGLYGHLISKMRVSILLSDYPGLKQVTYDYQSNPSATRNFKKGQSVNVESLRWCLIDAATVDTEFQMALADRWLMPLGNKRGRDIVTPMLTLTEHGGMVIAMRDWLSVTANQDPSELRERRLARDALKQNKLEFISNSTDALTVGPFGFPLPDATVAIVDPETTILAQPATVGEIWIDSPSLSGGFWGLADVTDKTFHAKCYNAAGPLEMDFLRTGLLGFIDDGELYVLGPLEDRMVQVLEPLNEQDLDGRIVESESLSSSGLQTRYYYSSHLVYTLIRGIKDAYDACVFQTHIEDKLVSVAVLETILAKPAVTNTTPLISEKERASRESRLDEMGQEAISLLKNVHDFTVFSVVLTAPNSTPRIIRSGRPDIAKLLARKYVMSGTLVAAHVKFDISSLNWIPEGQDPLGGIWSAASSHIRLESLGQEEQQFSGVDLRLQVPDERFRSKDLAEFTSLTEILQWRASAQPEELAYLTVSGRPNESNRETTRRRLDQEVAGVYSYLKEHLRARGGDVALLIYTHSQDFVVAVLACFLLGVTVVPLGPVNTERLNEDMNALVKIFQRYKVSFILGNHETQAMMDEKPIHQFLKQRNVTIGKLHNTAKIKPPPGISTRNIRMDPRSLAPNFPALVWVYWKPDHSFIASELSHAAILGMCKIQKETCQMSATKPIIGCVRSTSGLGFLYTCCLGTYLGASTLMVSPVDYANNPTIYFLTTSRYKVKDGYATTNMLKHATKLSKVKGYQLDGLGNLVVSTQGRVDKTVVNDMRLTFASVGLESTAINMAYGTTGNPMIATRSYMGLNPIDLWLDPVALRQGFVLVVNPANCKHALHLQDSGMVPVNTQVAIVNPETKMLCRSGEFGEIWVTSDGNQTQNFKYDTLFNKEMMGGVIVNGDPGVLHMRTGDFGFLHTVTKLDVELQVLFVLGAISQTLEVNGLQHFAFDIEETVSGVSRLILGNAIFSMGKMPGMTVLIVETTTQKQRLPSLTVAIVSRILAVHQFAVDVVVFLSRGKVPVSRLNEWQRRSLLQHYVAGSLPIVGQFGIQPQG